MSDVVRVVLIGFSGSGKSSVARLLAERLQWRLIDTDAEIENEFGISVPEIFATRGEPFFRSIERKALLRGLAEEHVIVATGGGATIDPELWTDEFLCSSGTLTVTLDAEPQTILERLQAHHAAEGSGVTRPMIAGDDPLGRIRNLKEKRQESYDRSSITLVTEGATRELIAKEITEIAQQDESTSEASVRLRATSASSEIFIFPGSVQNLGRFARSNWPKSKRAWIVSDTNVSSIHGASITQKLESEGYEVRLMSVGAGEGSKSWKTCGELLDWMLDGGIERGDVVVALGGGVIGDLAGFAAASVLRGVPLIQVPTSLLAMVDSSIGGKTGINHRAGKNLIGAFYQPPVVVIDPEMLQTLPQRELAAGWAEIIKHSVIQASTPGGERSDLMTFLERNVASLRRLQNPSITYAIKRNVALKAAVVEADEQEQGIRAYLNFGHTMGHAIEASDYRLLHGEAIAIGMRVAMRIALGMGQTSQYLVERVDRLIAAFGLPSTTNVDESLVLTKMGSDKKRVAGTQRWVLPAPAGGVEIRADVSDEVVLSALRAVTTVAR